MSFIESFLKYILFKEKVMVKKILNQLNQLDFSVVTKVSEASREKKNKEGFIFMRLVTDFE